VTSRSLRNSLRDRPGAGDKNESSTLPSSGIPRRDAIHAPDANQGPDSGWPTALFCENHARAFGVHRAAGTRRSRPPVELERQIMFAKYAPYCIDQGLSVFPARSNEHPAIPAWAPYRTRMLSAEEIEVWSRDLGDMNIAIVCGRLSDLTVIDCDMPQAIQEVETLLPEEMELPIVHTPGGGRGLEDPSGQPVSPLRETGDRLLPYPGRRAPVPAVRPGQVRRPVQANQEGSRDDRRPELRAER